MTYKELLLSEGGGVEGKKLMNEQAEAATVAIGLGGIGIECLRHFKKKVCERVLPDNPEEEVPKYSRIKFISVDADICTFSLDRHSCPTESSDVSMPILNDFSGPIDRSRPELGWFSNYELFDECPPEGTCGIRQMGRALFMLYSGMIDAAIHDALISTSKDLTMGSPINIHIFAGLGGGTGSGSFLDLCYIIRRMMKNGFHAYRPKIFGYFFLPDVLLKTTGLGGSLSAADQIKANSFAAMKELDYCMSFADNGDCWHQTYSGFEVGPTKEPPVDLCHLVSINPTAVPCSEDGRSAVMDTVSDYVMQFVVKSGLTAPSHAADCSRDFNSVRHNGANCGYCLIGSGSYTFPFQSMSTYLAGRLIEGIPDMGKGSHIDCESFMKKSGLDYPTLKAGIFKGISLEMPEHTLKYRDYIETLEEEHESQDEFELPHFVRMVYEPYFRELQIKAAENKCNMTCDWRLEHPDNEESVVGRVYRALADLTRNPSYGPFYAAEFLKSDIIGCLSSSLDTVRAYIAEAKERLSYEINRVKKVRGQFTIAARLFGFVHQHEFDYYMTCAARCYSCKAEIHVLYELDNTIRLLIKNLTRIYYSRFDIYTSVLSGLAETFRKNDAFLKENSGGNPFSSSVVSFEKMASFIDKSVEDKPIDSERTYFVNELVGKLNGWIDGMLPDIGSYEITELIIGSAGKQSPVDYEVSDSDREISDRLKYKIKDKDSQIVSFVSDFVIKELGHYTDNAVDDCIAQQFDAEASQQLSYKLYENVLSRYVDTAPMFDCRSDIDIGSPLTLYRCHMPLSSQTFRDGADIMIQNAHSEVKAFDLKDRIVNICTVCGVPMYAYGWFDDLRRAYTESDRYIYRVNGKHIYEGTEKDGRDWRRLYNLLPFSILDRPDSSEAVAAEIYDKAAALGIIEADNAGGCRARITEFPEELVKEAESIIQAESLSEAQLSSAKELLTAIEKQLSDPGTAKTVSISSYHGPQEYREAVYRDTVVSAPVIAEKLNNEIIMRMRLKDIALKLKAKLSEGAI